MRERDEHFLPDSIKGTGTYCERCGEKAHAFTGSYFNTETICLPCRAIEEVHPGFAHAQRAEVAAVQAGDMNYPGVGLPEGLRAMSLAAREQRQRKEGGRR